MSNARPPSPRSAPLAASGALLAALAVVGLARGYERDRAPAEPASTATARDPATDPATDTGGPRPAEPAPEVARLRDGRRLDVNRASAEELELLPRIGPTLAARIVEERERHGVFRSLEDLTRVRGIGPRTVEQLAPLAEVGEVPAADP